MKYFSGCWSFLTRRRGPDVISFNPGLVDILSLLTPGDIRRCKLVSRQWNDVITRHAKSLPRGLIELHISNKDIKGRCELIFVNLFYRSRSCAVALSNNFICLPRERVPSLHDYYEKTSTQVDVDTISIEDKQLLEYDNYYYNKQEKAYFIVNSMAEGFQDLLSFLLQKYETKKLGIDAILPSNCYSSMVEAFQSQNAKCFEINVRGLLPNLEQLYNVTGRNQLVLPYEPLISILLPEVSDWVVLCEMETAEVEGLRPLFDLIKSWREGEKSIKYILMSRWVFLDETWNESELNRELGLLGGYSMNHSSEDDDYKAVEILIRRSVDRKELRLYYTSRRKYIEVHDREYTEKPPLLVNHEWSHVCHCCCPPPENHDE